MDLRVSPDAHGSGDRRPALLTSATAGATRAFMVRPTTLSLRRRPIPPGPVATLACLDSATGKVQWSTTNHLTGQFHYIADPLVIQDQVVAIGQKRDGGRRGLVLLIHNRADGTLGRRAAVGPRRGSFDQQRSCQLTGLEDSCLATSAAASSVSTWRATCWARRAVVDSGRGRPSLVIAEP